MAKKAEHIKALEAAVDDIPTFDFSDDESLEAEECVDLPVQRPASKQGAIEEPIMSPSGVASPHMQQSASGGSLPPPAPLVHPPSPPKVTPRKGLAGSGILQSLRASLSTNAVALQQSFKRSVSQQQAMGGEENGAERQASPEHFLSSPTVQPDEVTLVMGMSDEEDEERPPTSVMSSPAKRTDDAHATDDDSPFGQGPRTPTDEERQIMRELCDRLVFKSEEVGNFSLLSNPHRLLVLEGPVDKKGTEARIKRVNRRYLVLLSDVLLIGEPPLPLPGKKPSGKDKINVKQVVELKHQTVFDRSAWEALSFEVRGPHRAFIFLVDTQASHSRWLQALRSTMLGLLQDSDLANAMGWQHSVYQGTYFSGALLGDLELLKCLASRDTKATAAGAPGEDEAEEARLEIMQAKDDVGMAPIHFSAFVGQLGSLAFFLDQGCDPDLASETLDTPLHYACSAGHYQAAALLLLRGASVHVTNFQDRTPLFECVVSSERTEDACALVELLHKAGADLATSDALGNTPLHKCALSGLVKMLATLLHLGADANILRETDQLSPLQVACMSDAPPEVLRVLLEHGALPNTASSGPRPLEILLTSRLYDSGDPGENTAGPTSAGEGPSSLESSPVTDGLDVIYRRLPAILLLIRYGARTTTRKLARAGVDNAVVNAITRAQQEWASKTEPSEPTSLVLDRQSEREEWAKDREKPRCPLCTASFSLLFRRHHCRLCGILACANCSTKRLSIANAAAGEGPRPDRVCDVCFNVTCRRILEAPAASPRSPDGGLTNPDDAVSPVDSEGADPRELQAARDRAELGLSGAERGKKEVDDAIARIKAGGKAYQKPSGKGGVGEVASVMAETSQLMHERGEKLANLADKSAQLQQSAMDFQEMAKQLAEREKNKKWWEF